MDIEIVFKGGVVKRYYGFTQFDFNLMRTSVTWKQVLTLADLKAGRGRVLSFDPSEFAFVTYHQHEPAPTE